MRVTSPARAATGRPARATSPAPRGGESRTAAHHLAELFAAHPALRLALGPVCHGVEGFRRSHRGAREAQRVARLGPPDQRPPLTDYSDVGAVALMTADPEHARWFAAETLGALAADDPRTAELRETLRAYLAEGRSPQGAAERLFVSRNTVTYRIRRAEELMRRPLDTDGLFVRLALEITRLLGPC
ncbi:helix-turn-helix domain-containing protein [Streptomyces sp. GC420]|uniref:PucR family transcriptional regulator n=1 Tax=Streptomyces sp. GC420 TaxID=2697568 RepID=UPI001414EAF0|nr:helix-turn-helix domain-containing protein [Streptomyces sp. GC420]NBM21262.1 hypothetical protein [Streptomyces sp. GC420]